MGQLKSLGLTVDAELANIEPVASRKRAKDEMGANKKTKVFNVIPPLKASLQYRTESVVETMVRSVDYKFYLNTQHLLYLHLCKPGELR